MTQKLPKYGMKLSLGGVAAEADDLLEAAFYQTANFQTIESKSNKRNFIIGRTGSGKSAALSKIELMHPEDVIRINPENLALSYITNLDIVKRSTELGINLELLWSSLWKHVFIIEIIRHRYKVTSTGAQTNILQSMIQRMRSDATKKNALDFLKEYENNFWEPSNQHVKRFTEGFKSKVEGKAKGSAGHPAVLNIELGTNGSREEYSETVTEERNILQKVVNENLLPQINAMVNELNHDILHDEQNFTYLIIDDLDTYWVDEEIVTDLIRTLFIVVMELKKIKNLKILIALRTNIFKELDFGKVKGFQEEKLRDFVVDMTWVPQEIEAVLDERVHVVTSNGGPSNRTFSDLLPRANKTRGVPLEYILNRTFYRPRDAITFANESLTVGMGKTTRLSWEDIYKAESSYSRIMIAALRDEWKETFPGLEEVIEEFRSTPMRSSKDQLAQILDSVVLLLAASQFKGVNWLLEAARDVWEAKSGPNDFGKYRNLISILFGIGFLGCTTKPSLAPLFYFDDPLFLDSDANFNSVIFFNVHRTYHSGLEIRPKSDRNEA